MVIVRTIFLILIVLFSLQVKGQEIRQVYHTQRIVSTPPRIDGLENDPAWEQVEWGGGFIQREPLDSAAPSMPTAFKILYDAKNIYVLIRAYDDEPEKIVKRMSRRDGFEGDWVEINIDSREDKRTAFSFTASVSGVKGDEYVSNDGDNWDATWDPIWYLKTSIDEKGWIAEFKIPLSQLRFANKEEHNWGIQLTRRFFRNEERSLWQYFPRTESGWVRHFGNLKGIKGIKPQKQLEIMPYTVAKLETYEREEGNPFADGSDPSVNFGVDGKVGLTSEITLDFTINPDFGQVEADPSQINLSAYRLYFQERRPFFIEGKELFDFKVSQSSAGGNFNNNRLFYSRNIGKSPRYYPYPGDNEYIDQPNETSIIAAAKVTGKNRNGFSWGVMESLTAEEKATLDRNGERSEMVVEPMTNYLIASAQKEFNKANTVIGGMLTSTNRKIDDPNLEFLHESAYSGGVDLLHHWDDRNYYISANASFSHVDGSTASIIATQQASERYFQRPDNFHRDVDTTLTSLSGYASTFKIGKNNGNLVGQTGIILRSPGYELNDVGFLVSTDEINHWTWLQYRILQQKGILRYLYFNGNEYMHWDYDGINIYQGLNLNSSMMFKNFWQYTIEYARIIKSISNADLRGGPALCYPGRNELWTKVTTDSRKKLSIAFKQLYISGDDHYLKEYESGIDLTYRPSNALLISLEPSVYRKWDEMQYVATADNNGDPEYIVGKINLKTYSMSARINFNITPNMSLQYWGQPFMSSGKYSRFKRIISPKNDHYENRYKLLLSDQLSIGEDGDYASDEDLDGEADYSFANPDFNFVQFRSNMVFRWEYIPGSELYLVWTQERTNYLPLTSSRTLGGLSDGLYSTYPENIFLIKLTYRFIR